MARLQTTKYTEWIDYRDDVLKELNEKASAATQAVGLKAVEMIVRNMEQGYGKPIRETGDLMRDVNFEVESEREVTVGNSLEYAPFVHEGTSRMKARPYIRDALIGHEAEIAEVYEAYLKE